LSFFVSKFEEFEGLVWIWIW